MMMMYKQQYFGGGPEYSLVELVGHWTFLHVLWDAAPGTLISELP